MPNDPTPTGNGPWRLLILDHDPADPKWIMATVTSPADVQPALTGGSLPAALRWVRALLGRPGAALVPLHRAEVWRVDEA